MKDAYPPDCSNIMCKTTVVLKVLWREPAEYLSWCDLHSVKAQTKGQRGCRTLLVARGHTGPGKVVSLSAPLLYTPPGSLKVQCIFPGSHCTECVPLRERCPRGSSRSTCSSHALGHNCSVGTAWAEVRGTTIEEAAPTCIPGLRGPEPRASATTPRSLWAYTWVQGALAWLSPVLGIKLPWRAGVPNDPLVPVPTVGKNTN